MSNLTVTSFECDNDLSQYTESMLFSSDTMVAEATFEDKNGNRIEFWLGTRGEVDVDFFEDGLDDDPTNYDDPDDFPEELIDIIKAGELWQDERVCVTDNNWFEVIYDVYNKDGELLHSNGEMFEDFDNLSPDELKQELTTLAEEIYERNKDLLPRSSKKEQTTERTD